MALETSVEHIGDLVAANPTSSDPKSDGDNHIRNLKTALLNSFAGFAGAVLVTGTDGGVVNAYTLTPATALPEYSTRMVALFSPSVTNTATAVTLNISGLGAKSVKAVGGSALVAGDLAAGSVYAAVYTGTEFRLLSITKNYADQLALATALPAQSLGFLRSDGTAAGFTTSHTGYAQNEGKGADIASAATIDLTTATGNFVHVTGTTTITAITIPSGAERTVVFDGVLTLTHNATSLILPTGANITTAAGDCMVVRGDGSGNARVVSYDRASGMPAADIVHPVVLLATLTPTAAAAVNALNVFTSEYDSYLIVGQGVSPAAADTLVGRFATAGALDSTAKYFSTRRYSDTSGTSFTASATSLSLANAATDAAGKGCVFSIRIDNANEATGLKRWESVAVSHSSVASSSYKVEDVMGGYVGGAVTGIGFYWSAGANFAASGTIRIYGIRKV